MSDVYVVNHGGYSYDTAKRFGNLIFMSKGYVTPENLDDVKEKLHSIIRTSLPTDYLLLSGSPLLCVIAASIWTKHHGAARILHWTNGDYALYEYT